MQLEKIEIRVTPTIPENRYDLLAALLAQYDFEVDFIHWADAGERCISIYTTLNRCNLLQQLLKTL